MLIRTPILALALLTGFTAEPSFDRVPRVRRLADAVQPAQAEAQLGAVFTCYRRAHDDTGLGEGSIVSLCRGAPNTGPVDCYIRAHQQTSLADEDAIALCRCTTSAAPVDCFQYGRQTTALDTEQILRLCAPVERFQLDETCTLRCR
jgi:hypothetical protein